MTGGGLAIVIEGTHEDWVGGVRTLDRARPDPGTDTEASDSGAELDPDGDHVWFRLAEETLRGRTARSATASSHLRTC